jgi:hypothetical protein
VATQLRFRMAVKWSARLVLIFGVAGSFRGLGPTTQFSRKWSSNLGNGTIEYVRNQGTVQTEMNMVKSC